jgi:ribokinase
MNQNAKYDVIVCGSLHLDIVVNAPALPRVDETAVGSKWQQVCGGKGGNQAVHAAIAGAKTAMIGRIGDDAFGKTLLNNLNSRSVDTTATAIDQQAGSGMSVAILQDNGEYGAVIVSGSNLNIKASEIEQSWAALGGAKILVLQNEVPDAVNVAAAKIAQAQGAKVLLNAAPARPLSTALLAHIDILVVNRVEAEMMSGLSVVDRNAAKSCLPLLSSPTRAVIVTLGGGGIVLQDRGGPIIEIEPIKVEVTSTHGAGDCFIGVLSFELSKEKNLEAACNVANAKAAAFVSRSLQ